LGRGYTCTLGFDHDADGETLFCFFDEVVEEADA
jgi:hypothetical protein